MRGGLIVENDKRSVHWGAVKDLLPFFYAHRKRIALAMAFLVAAKMASISLPFFLKHIVDGFEDSQSSSLLWLSVPLALVFAYGTARFLNVAFNELRDTLFGRVTESTMRAVGLRTFKHLHHLDLDFHLNRRTGALARDMERGTSGINSLMRFMVFNIFPTLFEVSVVVGILLYNYGWTYALVIALSVVAYVAYSIYATEWRTRYVREVNSADSQFNTRALDSLLNYETVKYFNNEQFEADHYDKDLATWQTAKRKNRLTLFALNGGQALIIAMATTAMLAFAAQEVMAETMTVGDFVLINAFMMQIFIPLNFLGFVYREIKGSLAAIEDMFTLLNTPAKVVDADTAAELVVSAGQVEFQNVHFGYRENREILKGISFSLKSKEKLAIVGASGSGKSTLVKLLFRFYDANQGQILIDGQDISKVTQHSLRQAIGIVPQDTVLFNASILENVRYGDVTASDEQVKQVMEMAHLSAFIDRLPEGWHTKVGERGLKLSGGEKQRVAIARTLLKRPPILVFDEATSSLDSKSEQAILEALSSLSEGHTSLVIAHRLSTIVDAQRIVVLDDGEVVEQGDHASLLRQNGRYAHMWRIQQQESGQDST